VPYGFKMSSHCPVVTTPAVGEQVPCECRQVILGIRVGETRVSCGCHAGRATARLPPWPIWGSWVATATATDTAKGTATAKGTGTVAGRGLDATLLTGHEKIGRLRLLCPGTAQ